jgi:hypothetical protein
MRHTKARAIAALTLTAVTVAVLLAACGSSSNTSSSSSSSAAAAGGAGGAGGSAARAKLVACLKQHGVTLPTRPPGARQGPAGSATTSGATPPPGSGSGGRRGFFFGGGGAARAGARFNNPKFQAAFKACGGGAGFGARRAALSHANIAKFVACVNQHGYKLPTPNFSGKGAVFPAKIQSNAKFQSAARACAADLRPPGGAPSGGPPPSGA